MTEEAIFQEALARRVGDRASYLDRACAGRPELRAAVEALLAAHEESGNVLDRPPADLAHTVDSGAGEPDHGATREHTPEPDDPIAVTTGYRGDTEAGMEIAGRYTLIERIGEGGMGEVWVAKQTEPVKRRVAVKLIKAGMDSRAVLQRFDQERQALAMMDHPNIARVLDGGLTADRRPFFVMELVNGLSLTKFCDDAKLTPRERLELFVPICQAIQHAHQKGIVHRDLKPANILVTLVDGKPLPKVIDFGVAKATGGKLTDESMSTQFGAVLGTLEYMSPEQAGFSAIDIDTRADIYSLGVILYELLTGLRPIDSKRLQQAALTEMIRIIQEEEPSKPSTRLSTDESLPSLAAIRQTEPKKLMAMLRGELDWVVMKCLEKQRDRRYETANGLARDIQRYLADEPVEARPPSATYRLRKFARKYRAALATTAAIVFLLVAGLGVSLWQMNRAIIAQREAKENERRANAERDAKVKALEAETAERQRAEKAEAIAKAERDGKARALDAEMKARQRAFTALRSMTDAVVERKFAAGRGHTLTDDDRAFLRGVIAQYDAFAAIQGDDAESRAVRAEGRARVGSMRQRLGELKEAEADYDAALATRKQLVADFPARPEFRHELAASHSSRGSLMRETGRMKEAETEYGAALDIHKQLAADFPTRSEFRWDLAGSYNNRGNLLRQTGRLEEAEAEYAAALHVEKQLAAEFPTRPEFRQSLARTHHNRGILLRELRRMKEAEADYIAALEIFKQLAIDFPTRPEFRQSLARSHNSRASFVRGADRLKEAEADHAAALAIRKQLAADFPTQPEFRQDLAESHNNRGALMNSAGRLKEAQADFDAALAIRKQLAADFPTQPDFRNELATTCRNLAIVLLQMNDWAEAKRLLEEGRPHQLVALTANPGHPQYRQFYRNHLMVLTSVHAGLLEPADAVRTAETVRDLGWNAPLDAFSAACFLSECITIVREHNKLDEKQRQDAVHFYGDEAMKLLRDAVRKGFKDADHIKKSTDLEPLREREDFKKLIVELEKSER